MLHMYGDDDGEGGGGPAADTGSAMHAAAAAFHRGDGVADAIAKMQEGSAAYPRADLSDAAAMFLSYAADPRNACTTVLVEQQLRYEIAPHETDPTGAPIVVDMTVDQVRELEHGRLWVTDIKTSKKDPYDEIMPTSYFQLAAYAVGAGIHLKREIYGAQILTPRKYGRDPGRSPVLWPYSWGWADLEDIMVSVRKAVADIRAGRLHHLPTSDCKWCHCRSPDICLPKLREHRKMDLLSR